MPAYFYITPGLQISTTGLHVSNAEKMECLLHTKYGILSANITFKIGPTADPTATGFIRKVGGIKDNGPEKIVSIRLAIKGVTGAPADMPDMESMIGYIRLQYQGITDVIGTAYLTGYLAQTF